jgi:tetratricopeptide (TPR) repeat protein
VPQLNHTPNLRLFVLALLLVLSTLSCARQQTAQAQRQTPTLTINRSPRGSIEQLRADLSMRFMEPAPHMALARYFRDRGDRLEAFYVLETARRTRFPKAEFNQAFAAAFGRPQPPGASPEGEAAFNLGASLQRAGKLAQAEEQFVKAAALSPDSADVQAWVGRFFYKVKNDNRRALDYYLNAYLLDPDAYESEFVESRIAKINDELAEADFSRKVRGGVPLTKIVEDSNPMVVLYALEQMAKEWKPSYLPVVFSLMGHDDGAVRWEATEAIKQHADRSFDPTLRALLSDTDPRKRGLAAYIAAHLWRRESFPTLREMLSEQSQLLRFDAISALVIEGGDEGRQIVFAHLPREQNPRLKQMIESEMSRAPRQPE